MRLSRRRPGWFPHGLLPRGRTLPPEVAEKRHRILLAFLWLHLPVLFGLGLALGEPIAHAALHAAVLAPIAMLAGRPELSVRVRSAIASIGLLSASALLVHMTGGLIESHFHFFVVIVAIALYEDWLPFVLGVSFVLGHHGLGGALDHDAVFAHGGNPWLWALLHGFFVAAAGAACILAWRLNEDVRFEKEAALEQARASQVLFHAGFHDAAIGVSLVGLDGRWLEVNRSLCEMLGYSAEELHARSFQDITHPADLQADMDNVEKLVAGEIDSYEMEKRYIRADGEQIWIQLNVSLVRDAAGAPSFFVSQIQDIDERKRSAEAVARLAAIVDAADDAIYSVDRDGAVLTWNRGAERIFGYTRDEIVSKRLLDVIVPFEDREATIQAYDAARLGRAAGNFETTRVRKDGETIDVSIGIAPLHGDAFAVIARDISAERERERNQQELERKLQDAQRLESLGVMAGGIAHDFNNLLMGVLGEVSLARAEVDARSGVEPRLERIETAARRAGDLTRQLLAYAGSKTTVLAPVDLSHTVDEMSQLLATAIPADVRVEIEFADGLPAVTADRSQLQQVVMNLITNAAEAYLGESGVIRVRTRRAPIDGDGKGTWFVRPRANADCVCLEVADDGSGMDCETLRRIFDPFFTTKFTGRGLGLAAMLGVVRAHGGGIYVESELGRGTLFRILLPASPNETKAPAAEPQVASGIHAHVLVVDDDPIVLDVAVAMLEHLGATTVAALGGPEALQIADEVPVDAAIVDVTMPGMSGIEVMSELRQKFPDLPILLSSGYSEHAAAELTDECTGFVPKPYSASELGTALVGLLERSARLQRL